MRTLRYTVTSCHVADFPVTAQVAGRDVNASVRGLVVEATSEDGSMGHTFRFSDIAPEDMEATQEEFAVGSAVTVTLSGAPAA